MDIFNTTTGNTTFPGNTTDGNTTHPIPHITYQINYFGYTPNTGIEYVAVALFGICTFAILFQNFWKRTWYMMALGLGGIMEVVAFAAMIYTTQNMTLNGYIIYLVCVLVAPTVLAASDYALAGHVMLRGEARVACFTPAVTKYLFLTCDIIAFFTQGVGGVVVGSAKTIADIQRGANIVLIGLGISLGVFVVFLFFSMVLHRRIIRNLNNSGLTKEETKWTRIFWVIYWNMLLLAIRALYRVAEFHEKLATPPNNDLSGEAYFYGFDTLLMILLMLSWTIFHPYRFGMDTWKKNSEITLDDLKK